MWLVYFNRRVFKRQRRAVPFDVVVVFAAADSDIAVIVRLGVGYPVVCAVQPYAADSDVCELADVCLGGAVEVMIRRDICVRIVVYERTRFTFARTVTILYRDSRVFFRFYGDVLIKSHQAACHSDLAAGDFDGESLVGGNPDAHVSALRYDRSSGDVHVALSLNAIYFTLSRDTAFGYCDAACSIDTVALVAFSYRGNFAAVYCDAAGVDAHGSRI